MKNIFKVLSLAAIGASALSSCDNDEFLEVDQYDKMPLVAEFASDANALQALNGIYTFNGVNDRNGNWGIKPNIYSGTHPTMDTQCTGWDVQYLDQTWDASTGDFDGAWAQAYAAINRANLYLTALYESEGTLDSKVSDECRKTCEGEALCLRGYWFMYLAQTFGRVPLLAVGEDFSNTPVKAAASTYEEMWDFIISDFKAAAELLDWTPYQGQYARCTKGMALSYLGDAYMWKAYRILNADEAYLLPENSADRQGKSQECYKLAKAALKTVLDDGPYKLSKNFGTNWDPAGIWNDECIWAMVCDEGSNWAGWSNLYGGSSNQLMIKWMCACPENGGWGTEDLSWEWYACYEHGDKRRDYSCVTGAVPEEDLAKFKIEKGATWGYHPYLQYAINNPGSTGHFHFGSSEKAPSIWTSKLWRADYADLCDWWISLWQPTIIYWKRLPNVMLDYAECCFRTGEEATGWAEIDELRARAWGKYEKEVDYAPYLEHYNKMISTYLQYKAAQLPGAHTLTEYPFELADSTVVVPDAKTYYTTLQSTANRAGYMHTSPAWQVAVNEERRKEFSSEWGLCPDMIKSGYMKDHINYNYPKDETSGDALTDYPWSHRVFDYDDNKMDMPIPATELDLNSALQQNPAYR